ncbi:hypothetical protein GGX14DRAFT_394426 [Mycena pura]|uniref:Uncharacterized protein n=1 Tax=Mycena pura TaxID=153505 RepID=A0AAD6YFN6_9AGAR|nr:hypothetical protein GGX14DRAFT_394426 [Mycena pura]
MAPLLTYSLFYLLLAHFSFTSVVGTVAIESRDSSPISVTASDWIWTATTTANTFVGLRKDFTPPLGKLPVAAEIVITASEFFTLFVNGDLVGSGTPPARTRFAQRFCADLIPSLNVFAVNASTASTLGGLIATILVTYSDGTTDTLVSDSTWRAKSGLPAGFEQLSFDDTAWAAATVSGSYETGIWASTEVYIPSDPPVLTLERATWIWTDVIPPSGILPVGPRAFRQTFSSAPGQVPATANIVIAADNQYTLYVNGVNIGNGTSNKIAQHYTVNFATGPTEIVLAVLANNTDVSVAGLLVEMEVNMQPSGPASCTAGSFVLTDAGWKSTKGDIPAGFEQPEFDDSAWPPADAGGLYGAAPWGNLPIAAASPPVTI